MNPQPTSSRLLSTIFYLLLAAVVLAPLAFWPSQYFAIESVKTIVIGVLTLAAIAVIGIIAIKEKAILLPPKTMLLTGVLTALSILLSALISGHFMKSFFGQGFELTAGSFLITMLLGGLVAFAVVARRTDRAIVLYAGLMGAFILIWLVQFLRLLAGSGFLSLGILDTVTSSLVGNWFSFGIFSAVIAIISFSAIYFLRLTSRMRTAYWVLFAVSSLAVLLVNGRQIWQSLAVVFLGLTIYLASEKIRPAGNAVVASVRRLPLVPLIAFVVSAIMVWQGVAIVGPVITKINASYTEISLPWRMTMDVAAGELKASPLFGIGPNRFSQAYLAYKPAGINTTDAWGMEFNSGFGLIPSFIVTQGFLGLIVWLLFFVSFIVLGVKSLRGLVSSDSSTNAIIEPERPYARFIIVSSYSVALLIWLSDIIYVPSHALVYIGFIMTGIWLGASVAYGRLRSVNVVSRPGNRSARIILVAEYIVVIAALLWGAVYIKNTAALGYFSSGVKALTATSDPQTADKDFASAVSLNPLDIYWQARAEAGISLANQLLATVTSTSTAVVSSATVEAAGKIVNTSIGYTNSAIAEDPTNYNNYVSQARVAELATAMKMQNAYATAVAAYSNAIKLNPGNPSLYLSLARLQGSQSKFDDAIQTIGASLQVKSNYLDAVYLLSQVEAAKGNLADAITAATFATQLNATDPLLFFQLGLLEYNKPDYMAAESAFKSAVTINPSYANAQYFLGLTYARLGKAAEAIGVFTQLAASNPDNRDIPIILSTLRAGKSLFAPGPQAKAARPETRTTPPIKSK